MEGLITFIITFMITFITLIAGITTIVWFIRDVRKENSKILKTTLAVQKEQSQILAKIEEGQRMGLAKIEEGQRMGFLTLQQSLAKIEEGQRIGFQTLQQSLAKIEESVKYIAEIIVMERKRLQQPTTSE